MMAGALLTKYQGTIISTFPIAAIGLRAVMLGARRLRRGSEIGAAWIVGPLCGAAAGLVLTSPHWLKNWVWYGDPLFPYLHHWFGNRWPAEAREVFQDWFLDVNMGAWRPQGTLVERLGATFRGLLSYSFEPHDWPRFHGKRPIFGSLFTLLVPCLPFLKARARLWMLFFAGHVAIFVWFWSAHVDRYLQVALPWMAASVAAALILVWRSGVPARLAAAALVGLQIVWGGDVYFLPAHAMMGATPAIKVSELLAMGQARKYDERLRVPDGLFRFGEQLPENARVLMHEENRRLGVFRPVVSDFRPWQFGLTYAQFESPRTLHDRLVDWGITHIIWREATSRGYDSLGSDLRFFEYVTQWAPPPQRVGGRAVSTLAPSPPASKDSNVVAYLGCRSFYQRGLHQVADLKIGGKVPAKLHRNLPAFKPAARDSGSIDALVGEAQFVVTDASCKPAPSPAAMTPFIKMATRGKEQLWVRRKQGDTPTSRPPAPAPPSDDNDWLDD
jgi:hypothetical protein